ncbi:MAG: ABC transporter permease [Thermoleophilia bacterium]|jgi:peptide/nickel transport system permease protein|nr:ABC transporter permease [Thermoleophilia bacterium]MBJ7333644.1 ABC transporter permease [Thermoleophilia bacterium]
MIAFALRRIASMIVVLFALSVIVFLIFFATPGIDPARQMAGRNATPETLAAIRSNFGLDRPLPVQYLTMMDRIVVKRDIESYSNRGVQVIPQIIDAAPVTFSLVFGAAVIWIFASISIGLLAASLRGTIWDPLLMGVSLIGVALPVFWLGEVANLITQQRFHDTFLFSWVPPLGYVPLTEDPIGWFTHLVIPWLVLSVLFVGFYARVLRSDIVNSENEDYVRTARSKGISERRVLFRHQLRTSMITFVSLFGLDFAALVAGGALLVEVVFGLPGVGRLTYLSLAGLDLPVIMTTVLYGAFFIVVASAIVDILYAFLDPRTRAA